MTFSRWANVQANSRDSLIGTTYVVVDDYDRRRLYYMVEPSIWARVSQQRRSAVSYGSSPTALDPRATPTRVGGKVGSSALSWNPSIASDCIAGSVLFTPRFLRTSPIQIRRPIVITASGTPMPMPTALPVVKPLFEE
jgi:hypothetical protein